MDSAKYSWYRIPEEDMTKWKVKPILSVIELRGSHVHCPEGYHYNKGYPSKHGYVHGFCVKNSKRKFRFK